MGWSLGDDPLLSPTLLRTTPNLLRRDASTLIAACVHRISLPRRPHWPRSDRCRGIAKLSSHACQFCPTRACIWVLLETPQHLVLKPEIHLTQFGTARLSHDVTLAFYRDGLCV